MTASVRAVTRLRAPELVGRGWLNTGGTSLSLADLRGRIVVLDFWTFCCVNCLHVLDELRPLEEAYADSLVLIGVHSPKFEHEADPDALAAAVERYAVHHPVLDDPDLATWQAYTARAWPTLVVIDPEGYIVASMSGEGHAHGLSLLVQELVEEHRAKGTLREGSSPYTAPAPPETPLRFPGKLAVLPDASFLVTDTAHHELVWLEPDLVTERRRFRGDTAAGVLAGAGGESSIGARPDGENLPGARAGGENPAGVRVGAGGESSIGARPDGENLAGVRADGENPAGARAGAGGESSMGARPDGENLAGVRVGAGGESSTGAGARGVLNEPQGILVLPEETASRVGYDVVVADSVNHQVRGLRLADGSWTVLAGTGRQLRERSGSGPALKQDLSTPWDVAWFIDRAVVAMAGVHQLWALHLATDPAHNTVAVLGGTSAEGLRDGAADEAWFAQPSGLAVSEDGSRLWVADSETSALRSLDLTDEGFVVRTHVGQGLFDFGHRDGTADQALLQHPLGVTVLPDGSVAVSDTYNGAIRRFDPVTREVTTLATGLREPSDAVVEVGDDGRARLVVVESAAHQLVRIALPDKAQRVEGRTQRTQRPRTEIASGAVTLTVNFTPPTGQKLDYRWGDPTRLMVSATPEQLLRSGSGSATGLTRDLDLDPTVVDGVLHVSVQAASCDGDPATGEVPEHAACHLYQQDWGIPVVLTDGATDRLTLDLRGVEHQQRSIT